MLEHLRKPVSAFYSSDARKTEVSLIKSTLHRCGTSCSLKGLFLEGSCVAC